MVAPIVAGAARVAAGTVRRPGVLPKAPAATSPQPLRPALRSRPEDRAARLRSYGTRQGQAAVQSEISGKVEHRVGTMMAFFLVAAAFSIDGVQGLIAFVPIMGQIAGILIGFLAFILFTAWFSVLHVNYLSGRRVGLKLLSVGVGFLGDLATLGIFPMLTVGVIGVILVSRLEDSDKAKRA